MFALDGDFDIDEDFLSTSFEGDTGIKDGSSNVSVCETKIGKPLKLLNDLHVRNSTNVARNGTKEGEFLNSWRSNDENIIPRSLGLQTKPHSRPDFTKASTPDGIKTEIVTRISKTIRPRRFPGPAGLLPERTGSSFITGEDFPIVQEPESIDFPDFEENEIFSQATNNFFEEPGSAWRQMLDDLGEHGSQLLAAINLASLRGKQVKSGFKVPFLAVCIHAVDCSLPDPSLILKDKMDEMHGTLHRDVWEEWKGELVVGCVLVLRNAGVVSTGSSSRRQFLNITANNITTIYSPKQDCNIKVIEVSPTSQNISEILGEWGKIKQEMKQMRPQLACIEKPLFNSWSPVSSGSSVLSPNQFSSASGLVRPVFQNRALVHSTQKKSASYEIDSKRPRMATVTTQSRLGSSTPQSWVRPTTGTPPLRISTPQSRIGQTNGDYHKLLGSSITPQPLRSLDKFLPNISRGSNQVSSVKSSREVVSVVKESSGALNLDKSIVESMLDGIDTDSLFEDF